MSTESEYVVKESRAMQTDAGDAEKLVTAFPLQDFQNH